MIQNEVSKYIRHISLFEFACITSVGTYLNDEQKRLKNQSKGLGKFLKLFALSRHAESTLSEINIEKKMCFSRARDCCCTKNEDEDEKTTRK